MLSPSNKVSDSRGRESFQRKRHEDMTSETHWVEIDLLRGGHRFLPVHLLDRGDYFVHVSPVHRRPRGLVWPIRLEQRLPAVPIPLLASDPDVDIDLQDALDAIFERARYDRDIDYTSVPVPPLTPAQAEWAASVLRDRGIC